MNRSTRTDEWDAHYASGRTFRPLTDAERRLLAAHAPAPADGVALDIGCGLGELARHLATAGYTVDALDHSRTAVALARRAGAQDTCGVTYRTLDIEQDTLEDLPHPAYDLITCRLAWAFVHDRPRVMNRLRKRLRPGGVLCVITPTAANVPDCRRDIALDEDELGLLRDGWRFAERYDADGLAFVVLRDPAPIRVTRPRSEY